MFFLDSIQDLAERKRRGGKKRIRFKGSRKKGYEFDIRGPFGIDLFQGIHDIPLEQVKPLPLLVDPEAARRARHEKEQREAYKHVAQAMKELNLVLNQAKLGELKRWQGKEENRPVLPEAPQFSPEEKWEGKNPLKIFEYIAQTLSVWMTSKKNPKFSRFRDAAERGLILLLRRHGDKSQSKDPFRASREWSIAIQVAADPKLVKRFAWEFLDRIESRQTRDLYTRKGKKKRPNVDMLRNIYLELLVRVFEERDILGHPADEEETVISVPPGEMEEEPPETSRNPSAEGEIAAPAAGMEDEANPKPESRGEDEFTITLGDLFYNNVADRLLKVVAILRGEAANISPEDLGIEILAELNEQRRDFKGRILRYLRNPRLVEYSEESLPLDWDSGDLAENFTAEFFPHIVGELMGSPEDTPLQEHNLLSPTSIRKVFVKVVDEYVSELNTRRDNPLNSIQVVVAESKKPGSLTLLGEAFLRDAALLMEVAPRRAYGTDVVTEPQEIPPELEDTGLAAQLQKWYELKQAEAALRRKAEGLKVRIGEAEMTSQEVRDAIGQVYGGMEPALKEMGDTVTRVDDIIFELSQRSRRSAKWRSLLKATSAEVQRLAQKEIEDVDLSLDPGEAVEMAMEDLISGMEVFLAPVEDLLQQADMLLAEERVKTHQFVDIGAEPLRKFHQESVEFLREGKWGDAARTLALDPTILPRSFGRLSSRIGARIAQFFRGIANKFRQMWMGKNQVDRAVEDLEAVVRETP